MASYVVLERSPGREEAADLAFVRDGFSWLAFLVPPLWLLCHRMWGAALAAFLVLGLLSTVGELSGFPGTASLLTLLVAFYFGLEGANLRIAALRRRGWREWGVVEAARLADAESRFAAEAVVDEPAADAGRRIVPDPAAARAAEAGLLLGLGALPGRG